MYQLCNLNQQDFLKYYWQKKPLVIKQGFSNFQDPIDANELAGLTEEDTVDSRIVSFSHNRWHVEHGPYEDINEHCQGAWSLLVQSVDHYLPEADELLRAFDFIPHWRMDDLMVSYSNQGAGVGPHLDQYDVFIVQGKGSRRWQVGLPAEYESLRPHPDLGQINMFEPIIDQVLQPGDVIYIPPNHPHNGVALEDCFNYSVGFRAPTQQEMLTSLADFALDNNVFSERYQDKNITPRVYSAELKQQEVVQFKELMTKAIETDRFEQWLATFLSQSKVLDELEIEQSELTADDMTHYLKQGVSVIRSPGIKPVFLEKPSHSCSEFTFYVEGKSFSVPTENEDLIKNFLTKASFTQLSEKKEPYNLVFTQLLSTLVNSGYWYLE